MTSLILWSPGCLVVSKYRWLYMFRPAAWASLLRAWTSDESLLIEEKVAQIHMEEYDAEDDNMFGWDVDILY